VISSLGYTTHKKTTNIMKIAIKHRTNNCKDYIMDHTVIIENLKEQKTLLSSIFLFGVLVYS